MENVIKHRNIKFVSTERRRNYLLLEPSYHITLLQINIIPLPVTMNRKIKKTTGQIKFLVVTIKQEIKLILQHSLYK